MPPVVCRSFWRRSLLFILTLTDGADSSLVSSYVLYSVGLHSNVWRVSVFYLLPHSFTRDRTRRYGSERSLRTFLVRERAFAWVSFAASFHHAHVSIEVVVRSFCWGFLPPIPRPRPRLPPVRFFLSPTPPNGRGIAAV